MVINTVRWAVSARCLQYLFPTPPPDPTSRPPTPPIGLPFSPQESPPPRLAPPPLTAVVDPEWDVPVYNLHGHSLPCHNSALDSVDPSHLRVAPTPVLVRKNAPTPPPLLARISPYSRDDRRRSVAVFGPRDAAEWDILWVELPGSRILVPYAVPEVWVDIVDAVLCGEIGLHDLSVTEPQLYGILRSLWVLASPGEVVAATELWNATLQNAADHFARHKWVLLERIFPPEVFAAIRAHCRALGRTRSVFLAENGVSKFRWSEPVATYFNNQVTHIVSQIVREALVPTRPITHWYETPSGLGLHFDGMPYAYSMSINVDETKDPDAPSCTFSVISHSLSTPLIDFELPLGGAIIFQGSVLPHYRDIHYVQTQTSMSFSFDRIAF